MFTCLHLTYKEFSFLSKITLSHNSVWQ